MKRISHDLPGVAQRIAKLGNEFGTAIEQVSQSWKDEKGRAFIQRHTSDVAPTINLLVSSLAKSIEAFEDIAKRLQDPDQP